MSENMRQLQLPSDLCQAAEQKFAQSYGTLQQFLVYVLQQLVRDDAFQMDKLEQSIIEERLRDLGYL
jgi:hypothetical protein